MAQDLREDDPIRANLKNGYSGGIDKKRISRSRQSAKWERKYLYQEKCLQPAPLINAQNNAVASGHGALKNGKSNFMEKVVIVDSDPSKVGKLQLDLQKYHSQFMVVVSGGCR